MPGRTDQMKKWIQIATERSTVKRAAKYAVVVGPVLIAINHGKAIFGGDISLDRLLCMSLTMLVPYFVSTASTVGAIL